MEMKKCVGEFYSIITDETEKNDVESIERCLEKINIV